ncbi:MAG: hypothetical protein AB9834_09005 [Lentimicrobium sp.]
MHRTDASPFLLYIEPRKEEKSANPAVDEITQIMQVALSEAKTGISNYTEADKPPRFIRNSGYRGFHTTDCGKSSTGNDYLLENGMITNSLCVFYLQYYRNSIPEQEMGKVNRLVAYYKEKYPETLEMVFAKVEENSKKDLKMRIGEYFDQE